MKRKLKATIKEHNCTLHTRTFGSQLLATYTYTWADDWTFRFTLLSEVAESLQEAFKAILRERGLRQSGTRETEGKPYVQDLLEPDPDTPGGRRWAALMPGMIPRWVRIYDNGGIDEPGGSLDCYTAVFTGRAPVMRGGGANQYPYLAMNGNPFHPQMGIGIHGHTNHSPCDALNGKWPPAIGRKNHLGKRIAFIDLPEDCQRCVLQDYLEIWKL
jgi:hypothetical protein